jgi:hypothetical protein
MSNAHNLVGTNKTALQELCSRKDEKYQTALAIFNEGLSFFTKSAQHLPMVSLVNARFQAIKAESKAALDESRRVINEINSELHAEYDGIESKRTAYDKDLVAAEQEGRTPPSAEGVDLRSLEELQATLETQRANLDLNLATNPGVIEQYEKRKRDVSESLLRSVKTGR